MGVSAEINNISIYDLNSTIYEHIVNDYMLQTGLSKSQSDNIFSKVNQTEFDSQETEQVETLIYGEKKNDNYENNVLFIQENYNTLISSLSTEDKQLVDTYFLNFALKYYRDYSNPGDFSEIDSNNLNSNYFSTNNSMLPNQPTTNGTTATSVAQVRVFADSSGASSILNVSGHAWISVKNISSSNITVGKMTVAPNYTVSIGTWGNKSEHDGLWYNLEAYFVSSGSYTGRASLVANIDSSALATLTSHIVGYDTWSTLNNCSSFAYKAWNKISSTTLSAGVINTPSNLKNSIINTGISSIGAAVPYNYNVYYANGSGTPIRSSVY
jgi:hypothetical protein